MRRLVLFDIDGTLIRPIGIGRRSIEGAFTSVYGTNDVFAGYGFHGRTDPDIIDEGIRRANGRAEDHDRLLNAYLNNLAREVAVAPSLLLPGVRDVLDGLAARPDVILGLVTGNVRRGADIKLRKDGIHEYFRIGAYGCDSRHRGELVLKARDEAARIGHAPIDPRDVVMIGDTENDVSAARYGRAVAVAVATGGCTRETLAALDPDHLFETMDPASAFLEAILP